MSASRYFVFLCLLVEALSQKESEHCEECPKEPRSQPVCASNGKIYDSLCDMNYETCRSGNKTAIAAVDWENCRGQHILCPDNCLKFNDPVCANDGHIYPNQCIMQKRNCGKKMTVKSHTYCLFRRGGRSSSACPKECFEIHKPVCGSDLKIYDNECLLRQKSCAQGCTCVCERWSLMVIRPHTPHGIPNGNHKVCRTTAFLRVSHLEFHGRFADVFPRKNLTVINMEACAEVSKCAKICVPIPDPVCGSDKKIYMNNCSFLTNNCDKKVTQMPMRFCLT